MLLLSKVVPQHRREEEDNKMMKKVALYWDVVPNRPLLVRKKLRDSGFDDAWR